MESMICMLLVTPIILAILTFLCKFSSSTTPSGSLPSPRRLPIIGNLHLLLISRKPMPQFFAELSKKIGPVYAFWFGWSQIVIVNDYEVLMEMLVSDNYSDRPRRISGKIISRNFTGIVMASYCSEFQKRKGLCLQAIRDKARMDTPVKCESNHLIESLRKDVGDSDRKIVSLDDHLTLAAVNIIWRFLFAQRFESVNDPEFKRVLRMEQLMLKGVVMANVLQGFPFLAYLPISFVKRLEEFVAIRDDIVSAKLQQHLSTYGEQKEPRDFTDVLLESYKTNAHGLTRDSLEMLIVDMYLTGFETTRQTALWLFLYLVLNPDVQKKCQKEIDHVVGASTPSFDDMHNMPYVRATISETLRKSSAAPIAAPHCAKEDGCIGKTFIPKGTTILPNTYASHFDEKYFSEPHLFQPERFLDENGRYIANRKGFLPFSEGSRKCIGQLAAWKEMFSFCVAVLQNFNLYCPPGQTVSDAGKFEYMYKPQKYSVVLEKRC